MKDSTKEFFEGFTEGGCLVLGIIAGLELSPVFLVFAIAPLILIYTRGGSEDE